MSDLQKGEYPKWVFGKSWALITTTEKAYNPLRPYSYFIVIEDAVQAHRQFTQLCLQFPMLTNYFEEAAAKKRGHMAMTPSELWEGLEARLEDAAKDVKSYKGRRLDDGARVIGEHRTWLIEALKVA